MHLREYAPTDVEAVAQLFTETIHAVNSRDYSAEQLAVWAPRPYDLARWSARCARTCPIIAEDNGTIVGFCELEADGHIDCFYVHKDYQGRGVGWLMYDEIERRARLSGLPRLYAEVSITALPFFRRQGFQIVAQQEVQLQGVGFTNFRMEKLLSLT